MKAPRTAREWRELGTFAYRELLQSVSPIRGVSGSLPSINWRQNARYFEGMADPYKVFEINYVDADGKSITAKKSTAELMLIDRAGYMQSQDELSRIISDLENQGIISQTDQLGDSRFAFKQGAKLITEYPFTNDVYKPDPLKRYEGMAVPKLSSNLYLTPKAFDRAQLPDTKVIEVLESIYTAIASLHRSCNANPMLSPTVHIGMQRLGDNHVLFENLDNCARDPLVPKSGGNIPAMDQLRGAWADNRFFGDNGSGAGIVYSNKNSYLPGLGNFNDARVPEIARDGSETRNTTRYVNPLFPEWMQPIHFAKIAPPGSPATAGFTIQGPSDSRWMNSLRRRAPFWSLAGLFETTGYGITATPSASTFGNAPFVSDLRIRGNIYDAPQTTFDTRTLSSFVSNDASRDIRRMRDWYYQNKSRDEINVADAMMDFACAVQMARFLSVCPPHVLLHSVMGFHNMLLSLSFKYVGVPYSTAISDYQLKMRLERAAIAQMASDYNLVSAGDYGSGFALYVKPPDSVVLADAGLSAATVASLSLAASVAAANPVAGLVCIALVGLGILVAEIEGGRAQALVTPRDRSREDLRDAFGTGIRSNWFRGYTPEHVVNSVPVLRVK